MNVAPTCGDRIGSTDWIEQGILILLTGMTENFVKTQGS